MSMKSETRYCCYCCAWVEVFGKVEREVWQEIACPRERGGTRHEWVAKTREAKG